jgi:hypothetical protein
LLICPFCVFAYIISYIFPTTYKALKLSQPKMLALQTKCATQAKILRNVGRITKFNNKMANRNNSQPHTPRQNEKIGFEMSHFRILS